MCTPNGPVCDNCRQPVTLTYGGFFSPELRFCSVACLDESEAVRRREARSKDFTLHRGWIDCAGKCRTWKVADGNGLHIAEVTRLRDAKRLVQMLAGRRQTNV